MNRGVALALLVGSLGTAPALAQDAVPPVLVVVIAGERVPAATAEAAVAALVAAVTPMTGGRPVASADPTVTTTIGACAEGDSGCVGRTIASAGAIGAVVARVSRARRTGPITIALDLVDPISGTPRLPRATASLEEGADPTPALAPLVEAFRPVMFTPPPAPPRLLVTVNVDGATVALDGTELGTSPLARTTVTEGHHEITVRAAGYALATRTLDLVAGDERRIDVVLVPGEALPEPGPIDEVVAAPIARGPEWYEEWWVWTVVGGVVVAGVAVGVGVGVASSSGPAPIPDPMGIRLPEIR